MQDFQGRTAVITGGASGIGLAVATRLAAEGMNLVLGDIEEFALGSVVEQFEAEGVDVLGVPTDVSDFASVTELAAATADRFGDVHVLFNNAGVGGGGPVITPDDLEMWHWVLDVDLYGVLHGIKAFAPAMLAHGEPCHVINTASIAGLLPTPGLGAYTVAKYAVVAMSETLALEVAGSALRVSVLCPGFVQTQIAESDRNIPEHLVPREEPTAEQEVLRAMVRDLVAGGIAPDKVADLIVEALRDERFTILPHPEYGSQVVARAERLVSGEPPVSWNI